LVEGATALLDSADLTSARLQEAYEAAAFSDLPHVDSPATLIRRAIRWRNWWRSIRMSRCCYADAVALHGFTWLAHLARSGPQLPAMLHQRRQSRHGVAHVDG
jgi:hypothetical protein